jgi:hypothetical protein
MDSMGGGGQGLLSERSGMCFCYCSPDMVCVCYLATLWAPINCLPVVETTAHTLAATLGLLALHQDIQDEVLQHILEVVGPTREPVGLLHLVF